MRPSQPGRVNWCLPARRKGPLLESFFHHRVAVGIESELNIDFGNNPNGLAAQQRGAVDPVPDGLSGCFDQQWMSANQAQPLDAPIFAYDDLSSSPRRALKLSHRARRPLGISASSHTSFPMRRVKIPF